MLTVTFFTFSVGSFYGVVWLKGRAEEERGVRVRMFGKRRGSRKQALETSKQKKQADIVLFR